MNKTISQVWQFPSESNPSKEYETLRYTDGSTSCNCPGWTRRVAADGSRSCRHTRLIDMGRADAMCSATHHYETHNQPPLKPNAQTKSLETPKLGQRRFAV